MDIELDMQDLVLVVDDDEGIREAVSDLLRSDGLNTRCFGSTEELLECRPTEADCILLDVEMPGLSGLELQQCLEDAGSSTPVVFMTGHRDVHRCVQAMKNGASDFLIKPFRDEELLLAVRNAVGNGSEKRERRAELGRIAARAASLTPRETEVMHKVVKGRMNKQIAYELSIAEITVKLHRGKVMRKMGASSVADLVRMADSLDT